MLLQGFIEKDVFVCRHQTALCVYGGCGPVRCYARTRHVYPFGFIMHSSDDFYKNVEVWEHMWSKTFFRRCCQIVEILNSHTADPFNSPSFR